MPDAEAADVFVLNKNPVLLQLFLELAYPVAGLGVVEHVLKQHQLPPAWITKMLAGDGADGVFVKQSCCLQ